MRRFVIAALLVVTVIAASGFAVAGVQGIISTDRFGYAGTTTKYATLADATSGENPVETIAIGNRDLAVYITSGLGTVADMNVLMGSWWYTTDPSGSAGWGNTRGNTGVGFLQLYDEDSSTDTSLSMQFQNFSGGYWTEFCLSLTGANAVYADPSNDYARFSPFASNTSDSGTYLEYNFSLTATGLQGIETAPGVIEATNHPTGVTGSFTGLFQNLGSDSAKQGFYVFDLTLSMENWAYENRASLTGEYPFADSYFATVPEPATLIIWSLLGAGAAGVSVYRRRRRAQFMGGDVSRAAWTEESRQAIHRMIARGGRR